MLSEQSLRLKFVKVTFLVVYGVILGTAFRYQVIGDESLELYEPAYSFFDMIIVEVIREKMRAVTCGVLTLLGAGFVVLSLCGFTGHVLALKAASANADAKKS